jgi:hypothetical protein
MKIQNTNSRFIGEGKWYEIQELKDVRKTSWFKDSDNKVYKFHEKMWKKYDGRNWIPFAF